MYKQRKNILVVFMILSLMLTGLPVLHTQDADRDGVISLSDAILMVRDLTDSVQTPTQFTTSVKRAIIALHTAAGLNTVIQPDDETTVTGTAITLDYPWLKGTKIALMPDRDSFVISQETFAYCSIILPPAPPPPKAV